MLVLSRKSQEAVVVGGAAGFEPLLKVTVLEIKGGESGWASRSMPPFPFIVWKCGSESVPALRRKPRREKPCPRNSSQTKKRGFSCQSV